MKHVIAPMGCAGGDDGRTGDIVINPGTAAEKRLPSRYADYPLNAADVFASTRPAAAATAIP